MIIQKVYDPSRRHDYEEWETVCGTLEAGMGTGGGNVPIVVEQFIIERDTTPKIGGVLLHDWRNKTSADSS